MKIIAHRGAKLDYPENTISAFKRALEIGVDAIEMDVLASKDGSLIVRHDDLIKKEGQWKYVSELTLDELKRIDLGNGERIPTLQEVFSQLYGKCPIVLDVKTSGIVKSLCDFLNGLKSIDGVHVSSFLHGEIVDIARLIPAIDRSIILTSLPISYKQPFYDTNTKQVSLFRAYVDESVVKKLHGEGIKIMVYTVNMLEEAEKFSKWGIDGIFTDNPFLMRGLRLN